jgi:hypothetical protein
MSDLLETYRKDLTLDKPLFNDMNIASFFNLLRPQSCFINKSTSLLFSNYTRLADGAFLSPDNYPISTANFNVFNLRLTSKSRSIPTQ